MSGGRGTFITFEGGDGAGKTTHIKLLADFLRSQKREVVCVREPGGTSIGEDVREILLDPKNEQMSDECELLLYVAARAQITSEVIEPALERGAVVLCDRFTDSTLAYQGFARGLDRDFIERANAFATGGLTPDRTILLTCGGAGSSLERVRERAEGDGKGGVTVGACGDEGVRERASDGARACGQTQGGAYTSERVFVDEGDGVYERAVEGANAHVNAGIDRIELAGENFHAKVNAAFLEIARANPNRFRIVDTLQEKELAAVQIREQLKDLF